jgi:O-antigen/teichoic acid export membrane protein
MFALVIREDPSSLRVKTFKMRAVLTALAVPILWALIAFGDQLVALLYDQRYQDAGWMVRVLAVGAVATLVSQSAERVLLAEGKSFAHMCVQVFGAVTFTAAAIVGFFVSGVGGMIAGMVGARYLAYCPLAVVLHRRGVWLAGLDLSVFTATLGIAALAYALSPL